MTKLKQRRDELACNYVTHEVCFSGLEYPLSGKTYKNCVQSYKSGFDAAVAELMPEIEKLIEALEVTLSRYEDMNGGFFDEESKRVRDALTNFREFMGDGE